MLTEEEAKTKWCPFVRFHGTPSDDSIPNRSENGTDITRCIASACMAWRTEYNARPVRPFLSAHRWDAPKPRRGETTEPPRPPEVPADATWSPGGFDGSEWIAVACWYESEESLRRRRLASDTEFDAKHPSPVAHGHCGLAGKP